METIVPSAEAVTGTAGGILKSVSTAVTEVFERSSLESPPAHTLAISHLEQTSPRGWTRPVFFFGTPQDADPMEAVKILRKALEPTRKAIPSLACEVVPDNEGKPTGKIALKPGNFGSLIVKDLRIGGASLQYDELRQQNFPQSRLEPDVLCPTDVFPKPGDQQPVFVPQVNIIDGGLILALSIHHAIFDAQGINEVLRVWAQNCHHLQNEAVRECSSLPAELFDKAAHYASREPTAESGRPEHHPEILIAPGPITFGETAFKEKHRSRVYHLSPKALAELKNDCTEPGESWISTNDAASALVWRSVLRAQVDDISELADDAMSHTIVNVDLRLRSDPPLSKNYPGGPMNYARPGMDLRKVLESDLAPLARLIRAEVDKRNPAYVDSLVTMLSTLPGYDYVVSASFPSLMATDVLTSTWYKLDILDLNWGPALGRIDRVRFTKRGLFNGLSMIYPQVTEGQVGMEIAVGLDEANFKKLEADPLWCKYAVSADPGYDCL